MESIQLPNIDGPTVQLCWKQEVKGGIVQTFERCDRRKGHDGMHTWEQPKQQADRVEPPTQEQPWIVTCPRCLGNSRRPKCSLCEGSGGVEVVLAAPHVMMKTETGVLVSIERYNNLIDGERSLLETLKAHGLLVQALMKIRDTPDLDVKRAQQLACEACLADVKSIAEEMRRGAHPSPPTQEPTP